MQSKQSYIYCLHTSISTARKQIGVLGRSTSESVSSQIGSPVKLCIHHDASGSEHTTAMLCVSFLWKTGQQQGPHSPWALERGSRRASLSRRRRCRCCGRNNRQRNSLGEMKRATVTTLCQASRGRIHKRGRRADLEECNRNRIGCWCVIVRCLLRVRWRTRTPNVHPAQGSGEFMRISRQR